MGCSRVSVYDWRAELVVLRDGSFPFCAGTFGVTFVGIFAMRHTVVAFCWRYCQQIPEWLLLRAEVEVRNARPPYSAVACLLGW